MPFFSVVDRQRSGLLCNRHVHLGQRCRWLIRVSRRIFGDVRLHSFSLLDRGLDVGLALGLAAPRRQVLPITQAAIRYDSSSERQHDIHV